MKMTDLISGEFARSFTTALTHSSKVTVLTLASTLGTAAVACGLFSKQAPIAIGGALLGVTSMLGWNSVHAPAYEAELKKNKATMAADKVLITDLRASLKEELLQITALNDEILNLSKNNEKLESSVTSLREKITELEIVAEKNHLAINALEEKIAKQAHNLAMIALNEGKREEGNGVANDLTKQAGEIIADLTQVLQKKELEITGLNQRVVDLTQTIAQLQKI